MLTWSAQIGKIIRILWRLDINPEKLQWDEYGAIYDRAENLERFQRNSKVRTITI